jgi:hypothetical protein
VGPGTGLDVVEKKKYMTPAGIRSPEHPVASLVITRSLGWFTGRAGLEGDTPVGGESEACTATCTVHATSFFGLIRTVPYRGRSVGQCFSTAGPRPRTGPWPREVLLEIVVLVF